MECLLSRVGSKTQAKFQTEDCQSGNSVWSYEVMTASRKFRLSAILCAAALAACVLAARPFAETGMTDDFSYIRSAQVLAETGHVVFNGWATTMVGWQLFPAALFIKLFGFSFTIVRLTTLLTAMATAVLFQRSMVRVGINEWNSAVGTLTLVLSPLALAVTFSFLTDMWSLFALIFCFYTCLRALQAGTSRAAESWIWAAAIGNALFGTVRQVAFLGVLVMVPCTVWLLRKTKQVVRAGIAACVAGYAIVFYALHWFSQQPFSGALPLHRSNLRLLRYQLPTVFLRPALEIPMLMLPVLLMFLPILRRSSRHAWAVITGSAVFVVAVGVYLHKTHKTVLWLIPFVIRFGSLLSPRGLFTTWPMIRILNPVWPSIGLSESVRVLVTFATIAGLVCLSASFVDRQRTQAAVSVPASLPWSDLSVLIIPFMLAYILALAPTGLMNATLDRYLLPLVAIGLVPLIRFHQQIMGARLPVAALALVVLIAVVAVPALHDLFSMYRATLAAANELRAAGVPRSRIDAGFEYNGWTQITEARFVHTDYVRLPPGVVADHTITDNLCPMQVANWMPHIQPQYSLSLKESDCGGRAQFTPVTWHRWFAPHEITVYIVKNPVIPGIHLCWIHKFWMNTAAEQFVEGCPVN